MSKARRASILCGLLAVGAAMHAVPAPATASESPQREVVDTAAGARVVITNEGDCNLLTVQVEAFDPAEHARSGRFVPPSEEDVAYDVDYFVTDACDVELRRSARRHVAPARSGSRRAGPSDGAEAAGSDGGGDVTIQTHIWYGNWLHSSQTMQDIINVDIAKFRHHHDRMWNDSQVQFKGNWYLRGSTSVSWNHPNGVYMDGYDGYPTSPAWSFSHGNFHSDFLWCNYQPGQNFTMSTDLKSTNTGGYDATFRQSRACSGTHMATSKWVSVTPPSEWCALYPTGQGC